MPFYHTASVNGVERHGLNPCSNGPKMASHNHASSILFHNNHHQPVFSKTITLRQRTPLCGMWQRQGSSRMQRPQVLGFQPNYFSRVQHITKHSNVLKQLIFFIPHWINIWFYIAIGPSPILPYLTLPLGFWTTAYLYISLCQPNITPIFTATRVPFRRSTSPSREPYPILLLC